MATSGEFLLATDGDFLMAMDSMCPGLNIKMSVAVAH